VRGGSGWEQFQRRKAGGWTGSGRVARGEGGEAVGRGDLGGAAARCREEEEEGKSSRRKAADRFYRRAQPVEERGRGRGSHGPSLGRRAAPACPRVRGSHSAPTARRGTARGGQRRRRGGGRKGGATRGREVQSCRAAHIAGQWRRAAAVEKQRREREVDKRGPKRNFRENQGPYCKA
jgi:hypothetical protein